MKLIKSGEFVRLWAVPGNWYTKSGVRVGGGEWRERYSTGTEARFLVPKDGTSRHRDHPPAAAVADRSQQLCHLVLDVGSKESAHFTPGNGSRILR